MTDEKIPYSVLSRESLVERVYALESEVERLRTIIEVHLAAIDVWREDDEQGVNELIDLTDDFEQQARPS